MDGRALARLEAWLSYFDDLGLGGFYRRGEAGSVVPAAQSLTTSAPPFSGRAALQPPVTPALVASVSRASAPPGARPSAMPTKKVDRPAAEPVQPLSVVGGPSLFESNARVEGDTLERIRADIGECTRCKLHRSRNRIVFGDGNPRAKLVFIGEGPGEEEDRQGLPFVGRAGKLLTQMIEAMGLKRGDVYIANVVKCRPPQNRTPEKDETETCGPFLERQLAVIAPQVIVSLGNVATQELLRTTEPMARLRGKWFSLRGAKLLPTYHPAYLLRNPNAKGVVWEDLQKVMAELGLEPPRKSAGKSLA